MRGYGHNLGKAVGVTQVLASRMEPQERIGATDTAVRIALARARVLSVSGLVEGIEMAGAVAVGISLLRVGCCSASELVGGFNDGTRLPCSF